jgi:hypothetical protein
MAKITRLEGHQIFVFGSNIEGRHGKGAALTAKQKFGAIQGEPHGLQGQSYGIITKDLARGKRSISLTDIRRQLEHLAKVAATHPELEFLLTPVGTGEGGYTLDELEAHLPSLPANVVPIWKDTEAKKGVRSRARTRRATPLRPRGKQHPARDFIAQMEKRLTPGARAAVNKLKKQYEGGKL